MDFHKEWEICSFGIFNGICCDALAYTLLFICVPDTCILIWQKTSCALQPCSHVYVTRVILGTLPPPLLTSIHIKYMHLRRGAAHNIRICLRAKAE